MPQAEAGKLRALAVSTQARWPLAPDIPTLTESGVAMTVSAWDALFAPRGTPAEIIETLNSATRKALDDPQLRQTLLARGARTTPSTPAELRAHVVSELKRWGAVVLASGAKLD
jgi:tripartite-type tricarboxylate transporter receptor subunit TctC